ncbi:MAG: hypothetical protein K5765_06955 [Clostridia bacterium]|nr:hypothetical protein [Clostridia bacterium]
MKKLNFVLVYSKNGKHRATVTCIGENNNLVRAFPQTDEWLGELIIVHYANSEKKALQLMDAWNDSYKLNGCLSEY